MSATSNHRFLSASRASWLRRAKLGSRQGVRLQTIAFSERFVPPGVDVPNLDRDKEWDFETQISQKVFEPRRFDVPNLDRDKELDFETDFSERLRASQLRRAELGSRQGVGLRTIGFSELIRASWRRRAGEELTWLSPPDRDKELDFEP